MKLSIYAEISDSCHYFNRTIIELKRYIMFKLCNVVSDFNRTIIELKQLFDYTNEGNEYDFNRTIIELKQLTALGLKISTLIF